MFNFFQHRSALYRLITSTHQRSVWTYECPLVVIRSSSTLTYCSSIFDSMSRCSIIESIVCLHNRFALCILFALYSNQFHTQKCSCVCIYHFWHLSDSLTLFTIWYLSIWLLLFWWNAICQFIYMQIYWCEIDKAEKTATTKNQCNRINSTH